MPFWPAVADLGKYLGSDLTANSANAQQALDLAVALVQNETEQVIAQVLGDVITLSPHAPRPLWPTDPLSPTEPTSRSLFLPERPITNVSSVVWNGTTLASTTYYWDTTGELTRVDGGSWGGIPRSVVVTYDHGLVTCPGDLKAVVLQVAGRTLRNPQGRVSQETPDLKIALPGVYPGEFSRSELRILNRYKAVVVG